MIAATASAAASLGTAAAVILATLFAYAAATKLADRAQTIADFETLGLRSARRLATLVPLSELALAAGLVARPRVGGLAAMSVLAVFTLVLSRALRTATQRGTTVRCSCFGAAGREPVSAVTLGRNGALIVIAAVAATQTTLSRPDLAVLVVASLLTMVPFVIGQLVVTHRRLGRIWSVELAGEAR